MREKDDGGQAFPNLVETGSHGEYQLSPTSGMTLRDYFAAHALQGIIAACGHEGIVNYDELRVSESAYLTADSMLKRRKR